MFILCMYSLLPTNFPIFITGKAAEDGLKLCNLDLKVGRIWQKNLIFKKNIVTFSVLTDNFSS